MSLCLAAESRIYYQKVGVPSFREAYRRILFIIPYRIEHGSIDPGCTLLVEAGSRSCALEIEDGAERLPGFGKLSGVNKSLGRRLDTARGTAGVYHLTSPNLSPNLELCC